MSKTTYRLQLTRCREDGENSVLSIKPLVDVSDIATEDEAALVRAVQDVAAGVPRSGTTALASLDVPVEINGHLVTVTVYGSEREAAAETIRAAFAPNSRIVELPEPRDGCEWVQVSPDSVFMNRGEQIFAFCERETVRLYDWAKTDPTVLVTESDTDGTRLVRYSDAAADIADGIAHEIPTIWQPHDGSDAPPIDIEACEVELRICSPEGTKPSQIHALELGAGWSWSWVTGWRFVSLRDGYAWGVE